MDGPYAAAKTRFGELIRKIHQGEHIIVERDGVPVLGILGADELEDYLDLRDNGSEGADPARLPGI